MQETRTAGVAAGRLRAAGYEVTTRVGKTGVVGLLRADMDALPVQEATGVPYASKVTAEDFRSSALSGVRLPCSGRTDPDVYEKGKAANRLDEIPT